MEARMRELEEKAKQAMEARVQTQRMVDLLSEKVHTLFDALHTHTKVIDIAHAHTHTHIHTHTHTHTHTR